MFNRVMPLNWLKSWKSFSFGMKVVMGLLHADGMACVFWALIISFHRSLRRPGQLFYTLYGTAFGLGADAALDHSISSLTSDNLGGQRSLEWSEEALSMAVAKVAVIIAQFLLGDLQTPTSFQEWNLACVFFHHLLCHFHCPQVCLALIWFHRSLRPSSSSVASCHDVRSRRHSFTDWRIFLSHLPIWLGMTLLQCISLNLPLPSRQHGQRISLVVVSPLGNRCKCAPECFSSHTDSEAQISFYLGTPTARCSHAHLITRCYHSSHGHAFRPKCSNFQPASLWTVGLFSLCSAFSYLRVSGKCLFHILLKPGADWKIAANPVILFAVLFHFSAEAAMMMDIYMWKLKAFLHLL